MNLPELRRALDHLAVLVEIRSRKQEKEDEDDLALILLALLATYYEDKDADSFKVAFLLALREAFEELDPDDEHGQLIEQELAYQAGFLTGFLQDLRNGKISEAQARARARQYAASLWKLRERIKLEKEIGNGDPMMTWNLGENENHCNSCPSLHGRRKRASEWARLGLYPKCSINECGQYCYCFWTY